MTRYEAAAQRTLSELATQVAALGNTATIGTVTVGCALWYLERRYAEYDWRELAPELSEWFDAWSSRPAVVATAPPAEHPGAKETLRRGGDTAR